MEIPKSIPKSHPSFLPRPLYSFSKNEFIFEQVSFQYNFYPPRTVPPLKKHKFHTFKTFNHSDDRHLIGIKNIYTVIAKDSYSFKVDESIHTAKTLKNQAVLASNNKIYISTNKYNQSLDLLNTSIDTNELTNEIIILDDNFIRIIDSQNIEYKSKMKINSIFSGEHPKEIFLIADYCVFFVDLRDEYVKCIFSSNNKILKTEKEQNYLILRFFLSFSVVCTKNELNRQSMEISSNYKMACNKHEIIFYKGNVFKYFKIDNLSLNSTFEYDFYNFLGFTANDQKFFFFFDNRIDVFQNGQKTKQVKCLIDFDKYSNITTDFFEKRDYKEDMFHEYEMPDVKCDLYDEIMNEINEKTNKTKVAQVSRKRVERSGGF